MESNRLVKIFKIACQIYLVGVFVFFVFFVALAWSDYVGDGRIANFCISVPVDGYYHFRPSEHNACLIDWKPFLLEAIIFPVAMFLILLMPGLIPWLILRARKQKSRDQNN